MTAPALPSHALADEDAVPLRLAKEGGSRLPIIYVREAVAILEVLLSLSLVGIRGLVGVHLGVVAEPRESEEVPHVELESHGLVSHLPRAMSLACS